MFSGIIKYLGSVDSLIENDQGVRLGISSPLFVASKDAPAIGESISVCGVCLTIVEIANQTACFDLATETCRRSTLGRLKQGSRVNLEQSLRFGERLDGHLVQGHVDAVAEVLSITNEGSNTICFVFSMSAAIAPFVAEKGSISIDGVSLTVGEVNKDSFKVYIIPYTVEHTIFQDYQVSTVVNIETDCIARYLSKLAQPYLNPEA